MVPHQSTCVPSGVQAATATKIKQSLKEHPAKPEAWKLSLTESSKQPRAWVAVPVPQMPRGLVFDDFPGLSQDIVPLFARHGQAFHQESFPGIKHRCDDFEWSITRPTFKHTHRISGPPTSAQGFTSHQTRHLLSKAETVPETLTGFTQAPSRGNFSEVHHFSSSTLATRSSTRQSLPS